MKDHFPLPFIDKVLHTLAVKKYFSFLDGFSGYNQIQLAPEDQDKTTFTCLWGTYAYRVLPFGLCNAPTIFQREVSPSRQYTTNDNFHPIYHHEDESHDVMHHLTPLQSTQCTRFCVSL